ncbi:hypothetical protein HA1_11091 [Clostridium perfringens F262]|uniref:Uncharacterized protein n=1 Tax=Clostridium perfringens F262 TaxID=883064 RepID=A0AAV3FBZ2_CLOPF|nr:hypothetical protein HA1_11091 [Clostridium perfringens F262]
MAIDKYGENLSGMLPGNITPIIIPTKSPINTIIQSPS